MRIAVNDGQSGGIGKAIVDKLSKELPEEVEIIALGTNSLATSSIIKAGAMKEQPEKMQSLLLLRKSI
jgi:hypothetical protein